MSDRSSTSEAPPPGQAGPVALWLRERPWFLPLALFALACVAYLPALPNGFIFDDDTLVWRNAWVTHADTLRGLRAIWTGEGSPDYFPLTSTTFWIEWQLWRDFAPGYHAVNILLHAASTLLLWKVLARLRIPPAALIAAAMWAVHPVNMESVAWIAERKNTLSMVLYLGSILAWLHFRADTQKPGDDRRAWYALSLLCFVLALLAKTSTVMLPCVLVLLAWWQGPAAPAQLETSRPAGTKRRGEVRATPSEWRGLLQPLMQTAPFFAAALALGLLTIYFQTSQGLNPDTLQRSLDLRIAQAGVNLWFYLYKTLLPFDLAMVYPEARLAKATPLAFVPLALWLALLGVLWRFRAKTAARHAFAGLAFFTLNLAPVLGVINMAWTAISPVGDHFLYIPMLGIVPLIPAGVLALVPRETLAKRRQLRAGLAALASALIAGSIVFCWLHAPVYRSQIDLWTYNTRVRPNSGFAFYHLGLGYKYAGRPAEAEEAFRRATELSPRLIGAHFELGQNLFAQKRYAEARGQFRETLDLVPRHRDAFLFLVECQWRMGDAEEATKLYKESISLHPDDPLIPNAYGMMLEALNRPEEALAQYRAASAADDRFALGEFNAGNLLIKLDRPADAAAAYERAVQRDPNHADGWFNLALALKTLGKNTDADAALLRAVSLDPGISNRRSPAGRNP